MTQRCSWCSTDPLYIDYHDQEWGRPVYEAHLLFEMLCLEGQQAGLSWWTVLKKRSCYRQHFFQYPIAHIAQFSDHDLQLKLHDQGLIRHIAKLSAIRDNAIAWQTLTHKGFHMHEWLWQFVENLPPSPQPIDELQRFAYIEASKNMSKALKRNGFRFVGPTTCYAFMQAVGMVNDHEEQCHMKIKYDFN